MPIYEYLCQDCQKRYERLVLSGNGDLACPHCGGKKAALQFSVFSAPRSESSAESAAPSCGCSAGGCGCN